MTDLHYDCEFIEDGQVIELISIGFKAESGAEYYAINWDVDLKELAANKWLLENVVPSLPLIHTVEHRGSFDHDVLTWDLDHANFKELKTRKQIAEEVKQFIRRYPQPRLWADYGAYDHVALCQLYGSMVDLPRGIPMYTSDLRQEIARLGIADGNLPKQASGVHNALADARHNLVIAQHLAAIERRRTS